MSKPIRMIYITCFAILGMALPQWVLAEAADRNKPIELEADSLTMNDAKKTSTYSGDVILTQGTLQIRADKLIVREDARGFQHSTSLGKPATFRQKMEGKSEYIQGSGNRIEYDGRMDKVKLFNNASVKRGDDVLYGSYISYDANAEFAEVLGGTKNSDGSSGRVKAIIQPKKTGNASSGDGITRNLRINKTLSTPNK